MADETGTPILVGDKLHSALGATEEEQDVDRLARQVVPVGAFNDPNNPVAASASVNLSLNDSPVKHPDDYGADVIAAFGHDHVENTMSGGARALRAFDTNSGEDDDTLSPEQRAAIDSLKDAPEDREQWQKAHWASAARAYGLASSGNIATVRARVEDHEAAEEERDTYEKDVRALGRDDLDEAARKFEINPEEYSTKDLLADAVIAAEYDEEVPAGDKTPSEEA